MGTISIAHRVVAQQQVRPRSAAPAPAPVARRFTVWCGSSIAPQHRTVEDLAIAAFALLPTGAWDEVELLLKAGEGGTWQSAWDPHGLALSGPGKLQQVIDTARPFGLRITPYVVVRGVPAWTPLEQDMIRACVSVAGRCILNVEPGAPYWNGGNDPVAIRRYLMGIGVPANTLEVCLIPRQSQVNELGGAACIQAWTDPLLVGGASWECYGITAGVSGPTSLLVNEAIPRLDGWGVPDDPHFRIPVVQRDERDFWSTMSWARNGMAVWYLDGN